MDQQAVSIPYFVHEATVDRFERANKRWFIAFLVVLIMLFITNGAWIIYEMQYETIVYEQDAQYDSTVTTSVLNNGTGRVVYADQGETEGTGAGPEADISQQSDENVPAL